MKVHYIIKLHLYSLIIVLPFLAVIKANFPIIKIGNNTLIGFSKELLSFSLLFILLFLALRIFKEKDKIAFSNFQSIYLFFLIWEILHVFIGFQNHMQRFNGFRFQFVYPAIIFLLIFYINNTKQWHLFDNMFDIIIKIFLIQSVFILGIAYVEIIYPEILPILYKESYNDIVPILGIPGKENIRIVSTFANPINLGLYLTIGFIFYLHLLEVKKQNIFFLFLYIFIFLIPIFLTFSRTSYGIFIVIFLLYYLYKIKKQLIKGVLSIFLFLIIIIYLVFEYANNIGVYIDLILYRIDQFINPDIVINDPRFENIKNFLNFIFSQDNIFYIWGGGLGISDASLKSINSFSSENAYITILAEQGIIGLFLFFLIIFKFFYNIFLLLKSENIMYKQYGFTLLLIIIWFLLASMTSDTIKNNPFSLYFWLFFFLSEYYSKRKFICS